jgi:hypothetical protein
LAGAAPTDVVPNVLPMIQSSPFAAAHDTSVAATGGRNIATRAAIAASTTAPQSDAVTPASWYRTPESGLNAPVPAPVYGVKGQQVSGGFRTVRQIGVSPKPNIGFPGYVARISTPLSAVPGATVLNTVPYFFTFSCNNSSRRSDSSVSTRIS